MGVNCYLTDESGNEKNHFFDGDDVFSGMLNSNPSGYKMLNYIDVYGLTYINRMQIRDFIEDLEQLQKKIDNNTQLKTINMIKEMAEDCKNMVHHYLKFEGD